MAALGGAGGAGGAGEAGGPVVPGEPPPEAGQGGDSITRLFHAVPSEPAAQINPAEVQREPDLKREDLKAAVDLFIKTFETPSEETPSSVTETSATASPVNIGKLAEKTEKVAKSTTTNAPPVNTGKLEAAVAERRRAREAARLAEQASSSTSSTASFTGPTSPSSRPTSPQKERAPLSPSSYSLIDKDTPASPSRLARAASSLLDLFRSATPPTSPTALPKKQVTQLKFGSGSIEKTSSIAESEVKEAALSPTNAKKMKAIAGVRFSLAHSLSRDSSQFLDVVSFMDLKQQDIDFIKENSNEFHTIDRSFIYTCLKNEFLRNVIKGVEEWRDQNGITQDIKDGNPQKSPEADLLIAVNDLIDLRKHGDESAILGRMRHIKEVFKGNVNIADIDGSYNKYMEEEGSDKIDKLMGLFVKAQEDSAKLKLENLASGQTNISEVFLMFIEELETIS